jgi:hypothetical protein
MPDPNPYKPPYALSVTIGEACNRKARNFIELAEKLKMDVTGLMRQANGHAYPSKALVKGSQGSWISMSRIWRSLRRKCVRTWVPEAAWRLRPATPNNSDRG